MGIYEGIQEIQVLMRELPGVRAAPNEPPDQLTAFPFVVCYVDTGVFRVNTPEDLRGLHNLIIEIHVAYQSLPVAYAQAIRFIEAVPRKLMEGLRDNRLPSLDTFGEISYTFRALAWGGVATLGCQFVIQNTKVRIVV